MTRRTRVAILGAIVAVMGLPLGGLVQAATTVVNGAIVSEEPLTLSPEAVAVVTLVDQTATEGAGGIVGQDRIDGVETLPVAFEVLYDDALIDPTHSYALFASIVDGDSVWQSALPVPALTGGPKLNVELPVVPAPTFADTLAGTVAASGDDTERSDAAVSIAILIKASTGTLVSVATAVDVPSTGSVPFSLGYDAELVDVDSPYVVRAAIVDGGDVWDTVAPADAIIDGDPLRDISVEVAARPEGIPVPPSPSLPPSPSPTFAPPSTLPTGTPSPTVEPTTEPTEAPTPTPEPTAEPTPTPAPTPTPTPEPTPTPTPEPTPSPTPEPTPSPTPTPTPSPSPSPSPSPTPSPSPSPSPSPTPSESPSASPSAPSAAPGTVTGTLSYVEPATLSADARALVVLVEGAGKPTAGSVVASELIAEPGQVPIPFTLDYSGVPIDQDVSYSLQATIIDGERTWVTTVGTPVITKDNPTSGVSLALVYRADVLKGDVTGTISGVDIELGAEAYSAAVLLDLATDTTVGIDVHLQPAGVPIKFSIPFDPGRIDQAADYVVTAAIVDTPDRWENREGVPVITQGNPVSDVTVPVSLVEVTPVTPPPAPDDDRSALIILALVLGLLALAVYLYRRSQEPEPPDETPGDSDGDLPPDDGTLAEPPPAEPVTDPTEPVEPEVESTQPLEPSPEADVPDTTEPAQSEPVPDDARPVDRP